MSQDTFEAKKKELDDFFEAYKAYSKQAVKLVEDFQKHNEDKELMEDRFSYITKHSDDYRGFRLPIHWGAMSEYVKSYYLDKFYRLSKGLYLTAIAYPISKHKEYDKYKHKYFEFKYRFDSHEDYRKFSKQYDTFQFLSAPKELLEIQQGVVQTKNIIASLAPDGKAMTIHPKE